MTEKEWLDSVDPQMMLEFLRGKASDRKLRLFACACCRRIWHLMPDERCHRAIEAAERYADGVVSEAEWQAALWGVREILNAWDADYEEAQERERMGWGWIPPVRTSAPDKAVDATYDAIFPTDDGLLDAARSACWAVGSHAGFGEEFTDAQRTEQRAQTMLLRDIFGNPFHPVTLDPTVLTWNDATVVRLAQAAYEERHMPAGTLDSDRLAVLTDALEEAGCSNPDILGHLRGPGPHVRGCWPVDLLLGKG
jgi:hypothetical protein